MKNATLQSEQCEVLTYIAKLQGRSLDALVGEILESWLTDNYADSVAAGEKAHGLPTTVVISRGRLAEKKAYQVMTANLKRL
jgi:hypothetical protein